MPQSIGVPVKLLHEAEGHKVTVELINGEVYRGLIVDCEDNMNLQMQNCTLTAKDGRVSNLEYVYIRGSKVRFLILPDMLKNAPMFKRFASKDRSQQGLGSGQLAAGGPQVNEPSRGAGRGGRRAAESSRFSLTGITGTLGFGLSFILGRELEMIKYLLSSTSGKKSSQFTENCRVRRSISLTGMRITTQYQYRLV
eukprot:g33572.t1